MKIKDLMYCVIGCIITINTHAQTLKITDLKNGQYVLSNETYYTGTRSEALKMTATNCLQPADSLFMVLCSKTKNSLFIQQVSSSGCWFLVTESAFGVVDACRLSESVIIIDYGTWTKLVRLPF